MPRLYRTSHFERVVLELQGHTSMSQSSHSCLQNHSLLSGLACFKFLSLENRKTAWLDLKQYWRWHFSVSIGKENSTSSFLYFCFAQAYVCKEARHPSFKFYLGSVFQAAYITQIRKSERGEKNWGWQIGQSNKHETIQKQWKTKQKRWSFIETGKK